MDGLEAGTSATVTLANSQDKGGSFIAFAVSIDPVSVADDAHTEEEMDAEDSAPRPVAVSSVESVSKVWVHLDPKEINAIFDRLNQEATKTVPVIRPAVGQLYMTRLVILIATQIMYDSVSEGSPSRSLCLADLLRMMTCTAALSRR